MDETLTATTQIAVLVCTYRRPDMLTRLLGQVAAIQSAAADLRVSCVVVDDDPASSAEAAVVAFRQRPEAVEVDYVALGSQDISKARNAAIERGLQRADWLAFIDDDCFPELDWLHELVRVQRLTDADVVTSGVRYFVQPGAPSWLGEQGFLNLINVYDDASVPEWGCMANVMLRRSWFVEHPEVRFDVAFGKTGGEDMIFLRTATAAGARMRWAAEAHVSEELPPARANMKYLLYRRYWLGNNNVMIHLRGRWITRSRMALRVVRKWVCWFVDLIKDPLTRKPFHGRERAAKAAEYWGMTLGLFGLESGHH